MLPNHLKKSCVPPFYGQTDCQQMVEIQDHCYTSQEQLTSRDNPKSMACNSLQGHKGTHNSKTFIHVN